MGFWNPVNASQQQRLFGAFPSKTSISGAGTPQSVISTIKSDANDMSSGTTARFATPEDISKAMAYMASGAKAGNMVDTAQLGALKNLNLQSGSWLEYDPAVNGVPAKNLNQYTPMHSGPN